MTLKTGRNSIIGNTLANIARPRGRKPSRLVDKCCTTTTSHDDQRLKANVPLKAQYLPVDEFTLGGDCLLKECPGGGESRRMLTMLESDL
ncbi:hypothetical protein ACH3XW_30265 [Acanthocheilonema viteae]